MYMTMGECINLSEPQMPPCEMRMIYDYYEIQRYNICEVFSTVWDTYKALNKYKLIFT